jgi:type III secretory pathway lipoprotein EscJ
VTTSPAGPDVQKQIQTSKIKNFIRTTITGWVDVERV